ncbi:E3 ubiquitin-protein ligase UBR2 isoform X2 [Chrysoperla carnea]|nr:E3 ubiquitin-protein ligase UBR2 isoform X2 [Chrysoperla carnea]
MGDSGDSADNYDPIDVDMPPVRAACPISVVSKKCISKWMEKMEAGILSSTHFKEYWRVWVPRIYRHPFNGNCLEWCHDEAKAQKLLFSILEEFICNGDPQEVLAKLTQLHKPPSVCGRVFKMGEPTYSCRQCGMDGTCVLCVDCFKQSAHRNHKYKMGTSSGGGCCDCGDDEAWKSEPYCDIHLIGKHAKQDEGHGLPEDFVERAKITFDAVLWYAYHLLTLEHSPRLPAELQIRDSEREPLEFLEIPEAYCTVLYNDETHTFEQVISTLARVIKCSQRDAIEFVTNIDREGRAVVKCSTFQHCTELKTEIEKYTSRHGNRPLKVSVVHSHVVAHQMFAIKLLAWLPTFLSHGEGLRVVFSQIACQTKPRDITLNNTSIVEGVLLRDSYMWKSARSHWHRLLISGMLMEYDSKKALATIFTKNYGHIMKDFIRDDHDHAFSVSSLSVQLYTVPTLAHHLIANEDVLFILLNTFISECARKCNTQGKLEFERNTPTNTFKRAQFILYDVKYLLSTKPKEWTEELRRGFFQGLTIILNLLTMMQGMDSVSRQVGQHMEYEPEWESAFNLHIKLAAVISLVLEWCGSDTKVLTKTYKVTLKRLLENPCYDPTQVGEVRELADHSAACLQYDVASQPVSIHLPLSRFLAGLHLYLEAHNLNFDTAFQGIKLTPEQIMEPVLRTQVMIAQVHAGMWRRNGYALLNQLYFYHNVKCRTEMLDRDIVILQIAAALIESNEFLIHVINKFNLITWANPDFEEISLKSSEEDSMRQTINLVEEFLGLLITIVGERYIPGIGKVTVEDRIKKEIVQQLCIKPLPRSELNKTTTDEVLSDSVLDNLIDEVATFKKPPQSSGKGVYELKPEYYNMYNVFFYHYTREELSKSEEAQRKRRKTANELECCPPPDLPELTESFSMLTNLLQSDVMLHVMRLVLLRSINLRARSFSEPQLHKVLHLIGYALQEQASKRYPFLVFTERANKWEILPLMEELSTSARVESHKGLLLWTLNKYKEVARPVESTETESAMEVNQPVADNSKEEKEWRAKMAAERRAKVMAQMAAMQNNFMKEYAQLFKESGTDVLKKPEFNEIEMDVTEDNEVPICLGKNQTTKMNVERTYTCILCQEEQAVTADGTALVLAGFVQQSTVLCQQRNWQQSKPENPILDPLFLSANLGPAPHTSTCGHVMHSHCWQKYFDNVLLKENRRPYRLRHPASFDVEKQEYLCPLCECLSNTILPLIPPLGTLQPKPKSTADITFNDWLKGLEITLNLRLKVSHGVFKCSETCAELHCHCRETAVTSNSEAELNPVEECDPYCITQTHQVYYACPIEQVVKRFNSNSVGTSFSELFPTNTKVLSENLTEMILLFSKATYIKGLGVNPHVGDGRTPLLAWKSCAYTIRTMEILLRDLNKPLLGDLSCRQKDCLESLVRIVGAISSIWKKPNVIGSHALKILTLLLENPFDPEGPSLLDWDSFGMLVPLVLSLPSLFCKEQIGAIATGDVQEQYIFHLLLLCHISKIIITSKFENEDTTSMEVDIDDDESTTNQLTETERILLKNILKIAKPQLETTNISLHKIWSRIKDACIPFLRCCVLFFHFLTDVPAPTTLTEIGGDTFTNMCNYLGLTDSCLDILQPLISCDLIALWCKHPEVEKYIQDNTSKEVIEEPLAISRLVSLPNDYSELINTVSLFTCPNSDREDSRNPTMCLACGEMLCSQSYCCQTELNKTLVGACTYHAYKCGAGVGIFLRVRECEILFLASPNRGCFVSPPYLDDYGETDQGLRRGNPLHLCEERYKKLHTLWLSHRLHEEIARALESNNTLMSTQWQHL